MRIAAMQVELVNLEGRTHELALQVTETELNSARWIGRATRLQRLVDEMTGTRDTTPAGPRPVWVPVATIDTTVVWPGDSVAAAATDTLHVQYDIARDLWMALGVNYQARQIRHATSTTTTTITKAGFPWLDAGLGGMVLVLVLVLLFGTAR